MCAAMATTVGVGFGYAAVSSLAFGFVRLTPAGGARPPLGALQDVLTLMVLPTALLLLIQFFAGAVEELDATTAESQRVEADRAIDKALSQRRTVLDGIIHDRVMTSLVAAGFGVALAGDGHGAAGRLRPQVAVAFAGLGKAGGIDRAAAVIAIIK